MSIGALNWALEAGEAKGLTSTQRFVLVMLGNRADEEGYLYPSVDWICRHTGYDRRTVQRTIKSLEANHLLRRQRRADNVGNSTSNGYWLAMHQPSLPLPEGGRHSAAGGRQDDAGEGAAQKPGGGGTAPPKTKDLDVKEKPSGQSPAAQCAAAYKHGIKARYGADYPGSAKLNGIMAGLVKELGAAPALQVVQAYMASTDSWYVKKTHAIEYLKRDAAQIWVALQQRTGTAERPPEKAQALLGYPDGRETRLQDYQVGDPEQIARRVLRDYASRIPVWKPKNVIVQLGAKRYPFSIEELRA